MGIKPSCSLGRECRSMPAPRRSIAVSSGRAHGFESIFAAAGNLHLQPIEPAHPSLISLVSARRSEELVRGEVAKASSGQRLSPTQFYFAAAITLGMPIRASPAATPT
jgi:hypothetical protein